eukprot:Awhi_evm1s7600
MGFVQSYLQLYNLVQTFAWLEIFLGLIVSQVFPEFSLGGAPLFQSVYTVLKYAQFAAWLEVVHAILGW